ncbi:RNAse P Rpr2/Rpp21/SNM1 subunit domain protein [Theileria parva strain Muguga]|uniref:RNAse P Rpr2/Rpp21/SNM1 subunit domain protein n=1 Tax=Theileria parva strain Muguga TaxID=333668 RepID=UPI001C61D12D|nr:RNAse P Rpr2/Rpp21/SNM1 subunit domain protein [Theileria parva strain Muguga]EAN34154.2 RNAse P Rpr2/Rpp21/SNM1 subunit domain protein [Theileria parva strain Muguga]
MSSELDFNNLDSIFTFKSKKYNKPAEKNKFGQRICFLLKSAQLFSTTNPNLSRFYIKELVEICEKHLIRLNPKVKRKFCKGCYTYFVQGLNLHTKNPADSVINVDTNTSKSVKSNLSFSTCLICTRTRAHPPQT